MKLHPNAAPVNGALKPDSTWTVANIKGWLDNQEIAYASGATKAELLALVV